MIAKNEMNLSQNHYKEAYHFVTIRIDFKDIDQIISNPYLSSSPPPQVCNASALKEVYFRGSAVKCSLYINN